MKMSIPTDIDNAIRKAITTAGADIASEFESHSNEVEAHDIEHEERDGFIPFTNGGFGVYIPFLLSYFEGSGKYPHDNFRDAVESQRNDAETQWISVNGEKLEALGFDTDKPESIHYHALQEAGADGLAEALEECVRDWMNSEPVYITLRAIYYKADNWRNPACAGGDVVLFDLATNLDGYGRDSHAKDVYACIVPVSELTAERIAEVFAELRAVI